jgi:putative ABC transport system permease protein
MSVVLRTQSEPLALAAVVRRELAALDPQQPLSNLNTMSQLLAVSVAQPRFNFLAFALFAAIAMVLAAVGIYGVLAYSVSQRRHEIGIRLALGAQRGDVLGLVVGHGMKLVLAGAVLGLLGAFALTRILRRLLFEVQPTDPLTFMVVVIVLAIVGLIACWLPAQRATRIHPMEALR